MTPGRWRRWLMIAGGTVLVLVLAGVGALKLALDRVPAYQEQIRAWVHQQTGLRVRFARVTPALRWYGPELEFSALELRSGDDLRSIAVARRGSVAIDVWSLIANARLLAGRLRLDEPRIAITRLGPRRFSIGEGLEFGSGQQDLREVLGRLPHGRLDIRRASVQLLKWNPASPDLQFDDVDLEMARSGDHVDLGLAMRMPAQLRGAIRLQIGVVDSGDRNPLDWKASLVARDVSLPGWHDLLPDLSNSVQSGLAHVDLAASGSGSAKLRARLDFTVRDFRAGATLRSLREVGGVFSLDRVGDRWALSAERVRALAGASKGPQTRFESSWKLHNGVLDVLDARFDRLSLDAMSGVVAVLPQKPLRDLISSWEPGGDWADGLFHYDGGAATRTPRWQVRARFTGASLAPHGKMPGFRGLTGSIRGDQQGGQLDIDAPGVIVNWPEEWVAPVSLATLRGSAYWRRNADQLLIASQDVQLSNPDLRASAKFAWYRYADGRPASMVLWSGISNVLADAAPRYLPRHRISPAAYRWLAQAFVSGHVPHADLVLRGPVADFPFRDGGGLFLVRFPAQDLVLNLHDGWPRLENLSLDAEFRNQGLDVRVRHARTGSLEVEEGTARFADFRTGELEVHARTHADAAEVLRYLAATPLDARVGSAFSRTDASGPLDADVELSLPFRQFDQLRTGVKARLDGVSLAYHGSKAAATQLRGVVEIDNAQVTQAQLRGSALGGPLKVRTRAARGKQDKATRIDVTGTASADGLRDAFDLPATMLPGGQTDWHGSVLMSPQTQERRVQVSSDLVGLTIALPEPLRKPAAIAWSLDAQVDWPQEPGPVLRASLADRLSTTVRWDGADRIDRAAIWFGKEPASPGPDRLSVGGRIGRLDLSGWLDLRSKAGGSPPPAGMLHQASISVGELDFQGLAFHELDLGLKIQPQALRVDVDGSDTRGHLIIPNGPDPWQFDFDRMKIQSRAEAQGPSDAAPMEPKSMPAVGFRVAGLSWGAMDVGSVQGVLTRIDQGVSLDRLKVQGASFDLEATGRWSGPDGGTGHAEGVLISHDVQQTLAQFGYAEVMQGKAGRMDFDLTWHGLPSRAAIPSLAGTIKLEASKGQILDINPGAGRVFGLASLASLPRRLTLDFSDLTSKGLAYDAIRGSFELHDGNAYTNNMLLEGPALEIGLIGRVGLAARDLDQTAAVAGKMGVTLPLASTLAAGPVVGAAVLVFSQLFKQPLKGLVRGYYHISGSWDNPQVVRLRGEAASEAQRESRAEQKQ